MSSFVQKAESEKKSTPVEPWKFRQYSFMLSVFPSGMGSGITFVLHLVMLINFSLYSQCINESITLFQTWGHTPVSFIIKFFCMSGFLTAVMHHMPLCYEQAVKIQGKFLSQDSPDKALTAILYSLDKTSQFQCSQDFSMSKHTTDSFANLNHVNFPPNTAIRQHGWQQPLHPLHPTSARRRSAGLVRFATITEKL